MFGKNKIESPFRNPNGDLLVKEVFATLQGEGPQAGWPAVFVRLGRCNLRCHFCDTEFEQDLKVYSAKGLFQHIQFVAQKNKAQVVVITGGEPLLQNVLPLIQMLNDNDIGVSIETAGTLMLPGLERYYDRLAQELYDNLLICSPKTGQVNRDLIPLVSAWKYIIKAGEVDEDGFPTGSTQVPGTVLRMFRPGPSAPIYYQPMDEQDAAKNQANLEAARDLAMKHGRRLSIQMHKLAGLP